jgi:hypothetical protein
MFDNMSAPAHRRIIIGIHCRDCWLRHGQRRAGRQAYIHITATEGDMQPIHCGSPSTTMCSPTAPCRPNKCGGSVKGEEPASGWVWVRSMFAYTSGCGILQACLRNAWLPTNSTSAMFYAYASALHNGLTWCPFLGAWHVCTSQLWLPIFSSSLRKGCQDI